MGLGLLIGSAVAASPFTPRALGPSLVAGGVTAGLVFGYRTLRAAGPAAATRVRLPPPPLFWLSALVFVALSGPTFAWFYEQWTVSIWSNGHGVFMPIVIGYLAHLSFRRDPSAEPESSSLGYAFLVPGLLLMAFDVGIRTAYLSALGFVLCLPGFALLLLGRRRARDLALPLALCLFLIPVPDVPAVHEPLRVVTAITVEPLMALSGTNYLRSDTVFLLPGLNFYVADDCSGLATTYASLTVAVILAAYARGAALKLILLAAALPLALAANVIRIFVLILLSYHVGPWIMESQFHPATGAATFVAVTLALCALAGRRTLREALT
jgi:exosortase